MIKILVFFFSLFIIFNPSIAQIDWTLCQDSFTIKQNHTFYGNNNLLKHFKPDKYIEVSICSDSASQLTYNFNNKTHLLFDYELFILDSNLNKVKPYSEFGRVQIQFSYKESKRKINQLKCNDKNKIKNKRNKVLIRLPVRFYELGNWYCTNLKTDSNYFIVLNQIIKKEEDNQVQKSDTANLIIKK